MNETTSPQPTRRGFFGVLGAIAAAVASKLFSIPNIRTPGEAALRGGIDLASSNDMTAVTVWRPNGDLRHGWLESTPGQLAIMESEGWMPVELSGEFGADVPETRGYEVNVT